MTATRKNIGDITVTAVSDGVLSTSLARASLPTL